MIPLTPEFWLQTGIYIVGGTSAVAAVAFRIGQMEQKFATKAELEKSHVDCETKRQRIYQRFDEYKSFTEAMFVRKDMCGQLHLSTKDEMRKMDDNFKLLRSELLEAIQRLSDKVEALTKITKDK